MERRQSLPLPSRERLTALSYPPERWGFLTILHRIEPPCGHWAMLRPRNQEMVLHVPTSLCRIITRKRTEMSLIVRRRPSRMTGRNLTDRLQLSPERHPEPNRSPTAQPNDRPEPNRNEPSQRPQTLPSNERSQPQHALPPAETRSGPQQRPQPKAEEKKQQNEQSKRDEKPPQ
jgi:hypothetical protein